MAATLPTNERAVDHGHRPLIGVAPGTTLREAARVLEANEIGAVAVMDGSALVGLLSERDLARAVARGAEPDVDLVDTWMSRSPRTARPDDDVLAIALQMLDEGVRHLPLVDQYGRAEGMISLRDIERPLLIQALTAGDPPG